MRWTRILTTAVLITIAVLYLCGCSQRQVKNYEYIITTTIYADRTVIEEKHQEWEYKRNNLASKETLDWLHLDMPDKGELWFGPWTADNDSMKLYTPYGVLETEPKATSD